MPVGVASRGQANVLATAELLIARGLHRSPHCAEKIFCAPRMAVCLSFSRHSYSAIWPISAGSAALAPLTRVPPAGGTATAGNCFNERIDGRPRNVRDRACADVEPVPLGGGGDTAPTDDNWNPSRCRAPIAGHTVTSLLAGGFPSG